MNDGETKMSNVHIHANMRSMMGPVVRMKQAGYVSTRTGEAYEPREVIIPLADITQVSPRHGRVDELWLELTTSTPNNSGLGCLGTLEGFENMRVEAIREYLALIRKDGAGEEQNNA